MFSYLLKTVILQFLAQLLLPSSPNHLHSPPQMNTFKIYTRCTFVNHFHRNTFLPLDSLGHFFSGGVFRGCSSDSAAAAAASSNKQLIIILVHASYFVSICCTAFRALLSGGDGNHCHRGLRSMRCLGGREGEIR